MWSPPAPLGMVAIEASYVPQILRLQRVKEATEVSVLFPALNLFGRLCAVAYAVHLQDTVLAVGFLVGIFLRATFFAQVVAYTPPAERRAWIPALFRSKRALAAEVPHV